MLLTTACVSPLVAFNPPDVPLLLVAEAGDNWLTVLADEDEEVEEETTAGEAAADDTGVLLALFIEPPPEWSVEFSTFSETKDD